MTVAFAGANAVLPIHPEMPTYGHVLQWLVICLLGVGLIMVNSASMNVGGEAIDAATMLTGRPVVYAALAVLVMLIIGHLDVRRLYLQRGLTNPVIWLLLLAIVLCALALVPGVGRNVNGASRWLYFGPREWNLTFQPSELAKWIMVLALAWWGARRMGAIRSFFQGFLPALLVLGLVCTIIALEDLGTGVLIGTVGLCMLMAAGARLWHLMLVVPPAAAGIAALIVASPYRMRRITSFTDPWSDPQGSGYHLIQSLNTIQEGGLAGRGLGNSVLKFGYLPEDTTDFVFAVICGELGLAGAVLVIGAYIGLILVGYAVIREWRSVYGGFGRLLGLGVLMTVALQALMNIAVVTGLVPTKGIALPLISNGGTGWVMTSAAIGLLVAIDRINRIESQASVDTVQHSPAADTSDAGAAEPAICVSVSAAAFPATAGTSGPAA